jgi:hypothetical protein
MPATKTAAALALSLLFGSAAAHANIVKLEIVRVEPAGPTHERITGKAYGELDPADPRTPSSPTSSSRRATSAARWNTSPRSRW